MEPASLLDVMRTVKQRLKNTLHVQGHLSEDDVRALSEQLTERMTSTNYDMTFSIPDGHGEIHRIQIKGPCKEQRHSHK